MSRTSIVARSLAVVVAVAALVGCSADQPTEQPVKEIAAETPVATDLPAPPQVGECWQLPGAAEASEWRAWEGSPAVDCAAEHTALTYAVATLPDEEPYPTKGEEFSETMQTTVSQSCYSTLTDEIMLGSRVRGYWFLPTEEQWEAGERWVRCDVAVFAYGPTEPANLEQLTLPFEEIVAQSQSTYLACVTTSVDRSVDGPGAGWDQGKYVDCAGPHQWEFGGVQLIEGDTFAGEETYAAQGRAYCEQQSASRGLDGWWAYWPNQESWDDGYRKLECWLTDKP